MMNKRKWDTNYDNTSSAMVEKSSPDSSQIDHQFRLGRLKQWRLIVRNLRFESTREEIEKAFSKFGVIEEIVLPRSKKDRSRGAGFAFVQFLKAESAKEAMQNINETEIGGRPVAVDWAVPKDQYMTVVLEEKEKQQREKKKVDAISPSSSSNPQAKGPRKREEEPAPGGSSSDDDGESSENEDSSDDKNDDEESSEEEEEDTRSTKTKKLRKEEHLTGVKEEHKEPDEGVTEERTIFVRNVPFETTEDELKKVFANFGQLNYCVICKYPGTDHSKGSAFVQFATKEDASKCLAEAYQGSSGVKVGNQPLTLCLAISKESARRLEKEKHDHQPKDKRNLHLLRVGLIRAGTSESTGVSAGDMAKRMRTEAANRAKIKNFNIFVSPTRLCVHNIPSTVDDKQLRKICMQAVDGDTMAKIKECRVMRDLSRLTGAGVGKSRGYAFVEFTQHEHAMKCLQALNNCPTTFTNEKRPIVEFSLENRNAVLAKMQRAEKAKMKSIEMRDKPESSSAAADPSATKVVLQTSRKQTRAKGAAKLAVPTIASADRAVKIQGGGGAKGSAKKQKAFPSHFGPKIRHRKRLPANTAATTAGKSSSKNKKNVGKRNKAKKEKNTSEKSPKATAVVKKNRKQSDKGDNNDGTARRGKRKHWYDS